MVRLNFPFRRNVALLLLAAALLAGCAGQRLQREGVTLLDEGRIEEGLAKLTEASNAEPDNLAYRTTLVRHRDQIVNRLSVQRQQRARRGSAGCGAGNL